MSRILIFLFVHLASCQQQYYAAEQTIQCYDGSLLPAASRCNNVPECAQGEDEYGCPTSQASQSNLVRLPEEHQQKIYVNSYPDYQDYQDYPDYQPQPGKESRPRLLSPNCNGDNNSSPMFFAVIEATNARDQLIAVLSLCSASKYFRRANFE